MIALLDTNAYTARARGEEPLLNSLSQADRILMSSIVIGELEYGFRNGSQRDKGHLANAQKRAGLRN